MEPQQLLNQKDDEKVDSMVLRRRMNNSFKKIQKSLYANIITLIIFIVVQVVILCNVARIHVLGVTVLAISILTLFLEGYGYFQSRWMKTYRLIITEFLVIFLEASIVVISIYQILDGALQRDGIKKGIFQVSMIIIFTGVSFYKLFPSIQLHKDYIKQQNSQKWIKDRSADESNDKNWF